MKENSGFSKCDFFNALIECDFCRRIRKARIAICDPKLLCRKVHQNGINRAVARDWRINGIFVTTNRIRVIAVVSEDIEDDVFIKARPLGFYESLDAI